MTKQSKPIVISCPEPRSLDLIFSPEKLAFFHENYDVIEVAETEVSNLNPTILGAATFILGQPPLTKTTLSKMTSLRAVLNVESNLLDNMPYDQVFERGIHVLTTGAVFAEPVAEIGLGFALDLARQISSSDQLFQNAKEAWGGEGNKSAQLISGSQIGIIGFGDLGKALHRLLAGFRSQVRVFDPWLPPSLLLDYGVIPSNLDEILRVSDFIFVVAGSTSENEGFIGSGQFSQMKKGAAFILLSRATVVDFDALLDSVASGHIVAASDVWPVEPLPHSHRARGMKGLLRSAHRAGALDIAFKRMGDMVLEDMDLMVRGFPPLRCKRAERETVSKMRSKPVKIN